MSAWGHKYVIYFYVAGEPTEAGTELVLSGLSNMILPQGAEFVGLMIETVEEEPNDQIGT